MRQSETQRYASAATAAFAGIVWASAVMSAPGSGKLCSLARDWVEGHCDGAKASRVTTPARCAKARDWLDAHCPNANTNAGVKAQKPEERVYRSDSKEDASSSKGKEERVYRSDAKEDASGKAREERAYRSEARDDPYVRKAKQDRDYKSARYEQAPRKKHARKGRARGVYAERARACCSPVPTVYYRTTRYRDDVFVTDYVLHPGNEAAFFRAYEANLR